MDGNGLDGLHGAASDAFPVTVSIVGAGLAGATAAIRLAGRGIPSRLISSQPSERAQSVLAEGGINAALNTMGENDSPEEHFADTMRAGCYIANPRAVRGLTQNAPALVEWLDGLGVPFQRSGTTLVERYFGGQKKMRTAYAQSSTGKALMSALIDEVRRFEAAGLVERLPRHDFVRLCLDTGGQCVGLEVRDNVTGARQVFSGPVIMACGGLGGFFPGRTTGSVANTGDAAATLFSQGVVFSNLEMIQYHPTTLAIPGKRLLVSEAARGEGGRLYVPRDGRKWYFMEERYPELGNLMPRDVVSREEYQVVRDPSCGSQVFLDLTGLSRQTWATRLPDLRRELVYYTGRDPAREPVAVEPGIHYFMGGIHVDECHRASIAGLYAAGECCSLYHGANRLGGNSTLGAVYGGGIAAETLAGDVEAGRLAGAVSGSYGEDAQAGSGEEPDLPAASARFDEELGALLYGALGVVREGGALDAAVGQVRGMYANARSRRERERLLLGQAMLLSAAFRKESRGAHARSDCPQTLDEYAGTVAVSRGMEESPLSPDVWLIPADDFAQEGGPDRA